MEEVKARERCQKVAGERINFLREHGERIGRLVVEGAINQSINQSINGGRLVVGGALLASMALDFGSEFDTDAALLDGTALGGPIDWQWRGSGEMYGFTPLCSRRDPKPGMPSWGFSAALASCCSLMLARLGSACTRDPSACTQGSRLPACTQGLYPGLGSQGSRL